MEHCIHQVHLKSNVFLVFKFFQKHTPNVVLAMLVDSALNKNNLPNVLLFGGGGVQTTMKLLVDPVLWLWSGESMVST